MHSEPSQTSETIFLKKPCNNFILDFWLDFEHVSDVYLLLEDVIPQFFTPVCNNFKNENKYSIGPS